MKFKYALLAVATLALVACGGGGGSDDEASQPEAPRSIAGFYVGTGSAGDQIQALITEDNVAWAITNRPGLSQILNGQVQQLDRSRFEVNGQAYGTDNVLKNAKIEGLIAPKSSMTGRSIVEGFESTFNLSYDASYEQPIILGGRHALSGGVVLANSEPTGGSGVIDVAPDGSFTGATNDGCTFRGNFAATGKAYANVRFVFGAGCQEVTGAGMDGVIVKTEDRVATLAARNGNNVLVLAEVELKH